MVICLDCASDSNALTRLNNSLSTLAAVDVCWQVILDSRVHCRDCVAKTGYYYYQWYEFLIRTRASLMLPPTFSASFVSFKCDLMLDCLPNDQLLAVTTLNAAIIASSSHHLRIIREAVRSQFVLVAWKRL